MKWHDVLKESVSPDSFKEVNLCVLRVSSAAGGEIDFVLSGSAIIPPFVGMIVNSLGKKEIWPYPRPCG